MSKERDLIYMTTTTNASVLANGVIPLTTIQRRTITTILQI